MTTSPLMFRSQINAVLRPFRPWPTQNNQALQIPVAAIKSFQRKLARRLNECTVRLLFPTFPVDLEDQFQRNYTEKNAQVAWWACIIGGATYLFYYFYDEIIDSYNSSKTLSIRLIVCAYILAIVLLPRTAFRHHMQLLVSSAMVVAGIGLAGIAYTVKGGLIVCLQGIVLAFMFNFAFFRFLFVPSMINGLIIWAAYDMAALAGGLDGQFMAANNFILITAFACGGSMTYLCEYLFRKQFLTDRALVREQEAVARQHKSALQYLEWLRQLATFMRHEVRQPVAQITSSIELIELKNAGRSPLEPHIETALSGAKHVWNLIERASSATDAVAFVRLSHPQCTELSSLLEKLTTGYRQTCYGLKFELKSVGSVILTADPTLIAEAVSNLLANAVSFAAENSTIEIELKSESGRARIAVRNEGPTLRAPPESHFEPFSSRRKGGDHHGIGLYLVRLIALQHCGEATIANLPSGVEATISLPLTN